MKHVLVINFKTYEESTGRRALDLAKIIDKVSKEMGVDVIIAVQPADIYRVSQEIEIPIYAQHVDAVEFGSHTGSILAESLKENGASGTLINHAERKIGFEEMVKAINTCKRVGLKTLVCSDNAEEIESLSKIKPDYIAFEDPDLIGTGKSISEHRSEDVKTFAEFLNPKNIPPLCGAGVSTGSDVKTSLELGTTGVLVASAIVKSKDPEKIVKEMAAAMK